MNPAVLERRALALKAARGYFDSLGFVEVETPVRIAAPAPEPHIDCPPVATGGFLRASPELQMKRLLADGMDKIYQIGPCFRDGEKGSRHNPEFTMVEWYRKGADYLEIARDLEGLLRATGLVVGAARRLGVREAYLRFAGWDPWEAWDKDRFDEDMALKIEPAIADMREGVFLFDYPKEAASLARVSGGGKDAHAERWEFYFGGMELANAFSELCDPDEQAARFREAAEERQALGEAGYPLDAEFLGSLGMIGSAAGAALGFDRIVMLLTGEKNISSARVV